MKSTRAIFLGLVVAVLSTLFASEAFSWWPGGAYVVTRSVVPQVYIGYPYPPCIPGPEYEYDRDPWEYSGPAFRPWRPPFRGHHRHFRPHHR